MIKINLLPEPENKKTVSLPEIIQQYKMFIIPVSGGALGIIILLSLLIVIYPKFQNTALKRLAAKWGKLEKDYQEVKKLKEEEKKLKEQLDIINYIAEKRLIWAKKLNQISDALPPEIQLTEMQVKVEEIKNKQDQEVLLIAGIVPAVPGERAIEEFIKNLKGDPTFVSDFPQMELPLTSTTKDGLKKFILKCYLDRKYLIAERNGSKTKEDNLQKSGK